jgi:DNA-directed RNA polymerase subunit L
MVSKSPVNVEIIKNEKDTTQFILKNVDLSIANGIRRTILTNIPTLVFKGFPYEENNIKIKKNTTKFNNEYLKHRLSCIPIHEDDIKIFQTFKSTYKAVINKENNTLEKMYVTTKDIDILNKNNDEKISKSKRDLLFPADEITGDHILICVLYPNMNSKNEENEKLEIEMDFDVNCAKENSCWNVVHNCTYEFVRNEEEIEKQAAEIKDEYEREDFRILQGQRIYFKNEYLMTIETLGIYSNNDIMYYACDYILNKLALIQQYFTSTMNTNIMTLDEVLKNGTNGTLEKEEIEKNENQYCKLYKNDNMYIFELSDDDYTIGKMIEKHLYLMYENDLKFVGFKKVHPTKKEAYIYIQYHNEKTEKLINNHFQNTISYIEQLISSIQKYFNLK